ncbi:MAG: chorismate synthase [Nonlabens sp.]
MAGNTFGTLFKLTTYGESHGHSIGGVIDGSPAGIKLDLNFIQDQLDLRKPGQSNIVTQRKESDTVVFLSGIFEQVTTGAPIGFQIVNENQKSRDYGHIKEVYRPSHADRVYDQKYGIRDYRGGGRSSARETACRVVAGAVAMQLIPHVKIHAYTHSVGSISLPAHYDNIDFQQIEHNKVRCPDAGLAAQMEKRIIEVRKAGDTIGGTVSCVIKNVPAGWGEPVFDKLHADLAKAMLSINAVKGFEYGSGFAGSQMLGSQHNDLYNQDGTTKTNKSGGIQGGISNGMDISLKVAFKPVATLMQSQSTIDTKLNEVEMKGKGRHDPCVVPRAVPIVQAMAALVLADHFLRSRSSQL